MLAHIYESICLLFFINFPSIQQASVTTYKRIHVVPGDAKK